MHILQSLRIALEMLAQHKMRAFLTMLGVIIGVMTVTLIVMISDGFQAYLTKQFEKAGANIIWMVYDPGRRGQTQTLGGRDKLTNEDLRWLMARVTCLDLATPVMMVPNQMVKYEGQTYEKPNVYGVDDLFLTLNRYNMVEGRSLTSMDLKNMDSVCLIGEEVRDSLFPDKKAIGKLVLLNGIALRVVGIIETQTFLGNSTAHNVYAPITMVQKKWQGSDRVDFVMLRVKQGVTGDTAMDAVWQAMMVRSGNRAVYRVDSNDSVLGIFNTVVGAAGSVLAAVAAMALLVGGIGIMNIMLVSVTERTREIGLRKAVGARRMAILVQFLIEAGTLSLIGGLIGMGIAYTIGMGVTNLTAQIKWPNKEGLPMVFPLPAALMAAAFSAAIGMVFGFYPAMSASKLDPIVALRTE